MNSRIVVVDLNELARNRAETVGDPCDLVPRDQWPLLPADVRDAAEEWERERQGSYVYSARIPSFYTYLVIEKKYIIDNAELRDPDYRTQGSNGESAYIIDGVYVMGGEFPDIGSIGVAETYPINNAEAPPVIFRTA